MLAKPCARAAKEACSGSIEQRHPREKSLLGQLQNIPCRALGERARYEVGARVALVVTRKRVEDAFESGGLARQTRPPIGLRGRS